MQPSDFFLFCCLGWVPLVAVLITIIINTFPSSPYLSRFACGRLQCLLHDQLQT
ncbi:hypothetical protein BS47DRAFT_1345798 [Hydnum rufescens UP504]|uniref:Uncharacterized protein n=1 Tax=Hydnum rufescens UP504 TaxID=1448309 RepID=A0A9P6AUY3_9AGAM|nr:hypothetical protein BS47DRAFT_1345798 [Hydnum rufescens UP504]